MTTLPSKRMSPANRKAQMINTALDLAEAGHYLNVTREQVAARAGFKGPLLHRYFGTMKQFRRAVMRAAVQNERLAVIAQGITAQDTQALKASPELQAEALGSLLTNM